MKPILSCLAGLFLFSCSIIAQEKPSPEAEAFFTKAMSQINPKHVTWVKTSARTVENKKMTVAQVDSMAHQYGVLGSMNGQDIEAMAFLVLMQASKSAQEELKAIMANVKSINNAKAKQREALKKAQQNQSMTSLQIDSMKWINSRNNLFLAGDNPDAVKFKRTRDVASKPSKADIDAAVNTMKDDLDAMSKMGEMESLRLQMAMDRMSKMMSTLSNILKKISDTANQIIQNLK